MNDGCETEIRSRQYWHWVALGGVVALAGALQVIPEQQEVGDSLGVVKARTDISAILQALGEYSSDNEGSYPKSLVPLVTADADGNCYLEGYDMKVPRDPWRREYLYDAPTRKHPKPRVRSLGSDGKPGGSGTAEDIESEELTGAER